MKYDDGRAEIDWFTAEDGGRTLGYPAGSDYRPTVVPAGDTSMTHYSVNMNLDTPGMPSTSATLGFHAIELASTWLQVGAVFYVMEGWRPIGRGTVTWLPGSDTSHKRRAQYAERIDYVRIPTFDGLYLGDSYVLSISTEPQEIAFAMELVLEESHPLYAPPKPGEHHCYRKGTILFTGFTGMRFNPSGAPPLVDPDGTTDLGNIDSFGQIGDSYVLDGEWGSLRVIGGKADVVLQTQPTTAIDQARALVGRMLQATGEFPALVSQLENLGLTETPDGSFTLTPSAGDQFGDARGVHVDAEALDLDGETIYALLHVSSGWLSELQLYRGDGRAIQRPFVAADFTVVYPTESS